VRSLVTRARTCLLAIDGVVESGSAFTEGDAFWVNGKQVAHFADGGVMQLRLTRAVISEQRSRLRADLRIELRHGASDWIKIHLTNARDLALLGELAGLAAAAHRAPPGTMPEPPPVGAALERRRRFH
jgi:Family of unknown function (DUF5519)